MLIAMANYPSEYEYPPPPHPMAAAPMRPTLDVYYPPTHQAPAFHAASASPSPQHAYYVAPQHHYLQHYASTPSALASASTLKRKMSGSSVATTPAAASTPGHSGASPSALAHDKLCDLCHHPDPILFSAKCGHLFHSRCVHVWPLHQCPVCHGELAHVSLLRIDMNEQIETRSGKWTRAEEKFIEIILQEFDRNCLPLSNGTPVRLVLAKLLNCSTMRLSKKFQKNALGKRTFRIPKPAKGLVAIEFNADEHVMREKEFSRLETIFRHELVEQFRRENNTDEGAYVETMNLRKAVKQFWVANFLKFAVVIGQPVEGLDISDAKKKKLALQMLRDGQYDALLSWHGAAACSPSRALPSRDHHAPHWSGAYANPAVHHADMDYQPVKKQRTPETLARLQISEAPPHFDMHAAPPHHSVQAYEYGRMSYGSHYEHSGYANYAPVKQERDSYDSLVHSPPQQHQQVQPYPEPPTAHELTSYADRQAASVAMTHAGYRTTTTTSAPMADASFHSMAPEHHPASGEPAPAGNPWDGLLEEISTEPQQHVVDPSLQAWSNLSMM